MVFVNIRIVTNSALTAGTSYTISGFPRCRNTNALNTVPVIISSPTGMSNGYLTIGGVFTFTPSTGSGIGSGAVLIFGTSYVTI